MELALTEQKRVAGLVSSRMPLVYKQGKPPYWHYLAVSSYRPKKLKKVYRAKEYRVQKDILARHQYLATRLISGWLERRGEKWSTWKEFYKQQGIE